MDVIATLAPYVEDEIEDPDEETFLLYSQPIPSQNLGFIDPKASTLDVTVGEREYTIHQSPAVLSSSRAGGTTGAVLWKVTPSFATWLSNPQNPLFTTSLLSPTSTILELGCGISTLNALSLSRSISRYILTDQPYVQKLIQRNIDDNLPSSSATKSSTAKSKRNHHHHHHQQNAAKIEFRTLDWETDEVTPSLTGSPDLRSFDAVLACDCVFNYALVEPFVQTCADVCRLRMKDEGNDTPSLCIVAQQLRNDEVFNSWLTRFQTDFRAWRVKDEYLPDELKSSAGFVVHIGVLREEE